MAAFQWAGSISGTGRKELNTGFAADHNPITGSATDKNHNRCAHGRAHPRSDIDSNAPSNGHRHGLAAGF